MFVPFTEFLTGNVILIQHEKISSLHGYKDTDENEGEYDLTSISIDGRVGITVKGNPYEVVSRITAHLLGNEES